MSYYEQPKEPPLAFRRILFRNRLLFTIRENPRISACVFVWIMIFVYFVIKASSLMSLEEKQNAQRAERSAIRKDTRLFYNRVPKCGSSTLVHLLEKLSVRNDFTHHSSVLLDDWALFREVDQKSFIGDFLLSSPSSTFDRHLFFIDFTRFRFPNPIYINLIRDPTERFISEFYFRRRLQEEGVKRGEKKWLEEDLDTCIERGKDYDCRIIDGSYRKNMIAFFCGNNIECSKHNDRTALESAKRNVETFYEVVGTLEDLLLTLQVLEKKIPQYFSGVVALYQLDSDHIINKGKNKAPKVSELTKELIRKNLSMEYEFYHFVRERLIQQSTDL